MPGGLSVRITREPNYRHANSGSFSLPRKPGCPFQARLFALVALRLTCVTLQATLDYRSRRGVSRSAAGTLPAGSNHVRGPPHPPTPLGLTPNSTLAASRPAQDPIPTPHPHGSPSFGWSVWKAPRRPCSPCPKQCFGFAGRSRGGSPDARPSGRHSVSRQRHGLNHCALIEEQFRVREKVKGGI